MVRTYTGANYPKWGLYTFDNFIEDPDGKKFPDNVLAALKANPGLERHFVEQAIFAGGTPPGTPQPVSGGAIPVIPRGTPIRNQASSFTIIGKR